MFTAALCALPLAACNQDTSWTYRTADGKYEVTSGMYVGMSLNAYNEGFSQEGVDTAQSLYGQQIGSVDGLTWVEQRVDNLAKKYLAVESKFDEYGLSFSEDEQAYVDSYVDYIWSYMGASYEDEGCGEESYRKLVTNSFKESQLFYDIYGVDGERAVSEEELRGLFDEQYAHINIFDVDAADEEGEPLTGHPLEIVEEKVGELIGQLDDGADFETVKADYEAEVEAAEAAGEEEDADAAAEAASEETADETAEEETDTSAYINAETSSYPEELVTTLMEASDGAYGSYDDGEGTIYVWIRLENDDEGFEAYRDTILQNEKWEEFTQYEQDWVNGMTFTENDVSIRKHSPKHLE